MNPIRAQIKDIKDGLVKEKKTRVANEKSILKQSEEQSEKMQEDIRTETRLRKERMQDLDDFLTQDTELTTKFLD